MSADFGVLLGSILGASGGQHENMRRETRVPDQKQQSRDTAFTKAGIFYNTAIHRCKTSVRKELPDEYQRKRTSGQLRIVSDRQLCR